MTLSRDASTGFISGTTVGNTSSQQLYSNFGEVSDLNFSVSGSQIFDQAIAERDALGRVKHLTETVQGTAHDISYEYNTGGRLSKETRDGVTTTYTYDQNGNRTGVQVGSAPATSATYDAQDRIQTNGTQSYTFTAHGDLQTRTDKCLYTCGGHDRGCHVCRMWLPIRSSTSSCCLRRRLWAVFRILG